MPKHGKECSRNNVESALIILFLICKNLELTDRTLSEIAGQLTHIGDRWEKLGFYLNVDQNTVARIRYEQRSTMSKIYQLLRRWRERTRDASWAQLEQAIKWIGVTLQPPPGVHHFNLHQVQLVTQHQIIQDLHQMFLVNSKCVHLGTCPWSHLYKVHTFRLLTPRQLSIAPLVLAYTL